MASSCSMPLRRLQDLCHLRTRSASHLSSQGMPCSVGTPQLQAPCLRREPTLGRSTWHHMDARSLLLLLDRWWDQRNPSFRSKLEARIASIESSTSAFQCETQKQITQLDTNLRQQAHDTQNRLHSCGMRFDEHQKEVAQQLLASSQSLEASLVKTMRHENQAIHGTLAALQEMFQENLGRKKPKESNE